MDVRHVCNHDGDCSVWKINPITEEHSKVCDCGALKLAVHKASGKGCDDLWEAWTAHLIAIDKSMGMSYD